ncbi:arsenate reductase (thioredoxin) [Lentilactobacillus buchneri]|uniref:Arsenate reductase n=1 Tax=Lentilactobacillus buchneri DSM 20057 TaxID=1423728 RepID=A0A4R5NS13_LENBU|nr:arsenate reductase (thioredoxin) [Lentilactobacillus buchneri]AEB72405.1 protein tyrosine phosphatase [Lentilactobacillus buchneri NRRL B-30929]KRK68491.1 protein tyrosine phosphatase [Lentilactobacillus buchneri DSM 20057]MCT2881569.1 arsenate reductase (thioredoxin) [Lentilactobacillus buchneri]MCT2898072.1 arsenate reductase (thioredoxin) [Lentilactobacillus buchneri]MCT3252924.1 arsenate reductase (thioredoxin) [Lentilactobacillus buchneri]
MGQKTIYFLCTGNSCRSQMAEGFGKQYLGDHYRVFSAGIEKHGVNPMAVQVMAEAGVDISSQTSKLIDPTILNHADLVVTLCSDAEKRCPITPPQVARQHWPFPDPAAATGSSSEQLQVFREVRDAIKARIIDFANLEADQKNH